MSQAFSNDAERLAWERTPEPGWIESAGGPIFAWYHAPRGPIRSRAVLLCDPLTSDRMNLHLSYRHLALRLSACGYPTLRFDYPGTGDSSGSPRDPGWSDRWQESLEVALETLLARSGLGQAAVFGARFGGTLAAQFAATRPEVDSVLLWGPYLSGRAFLRDARAMHRLLRANESQRRPDRFEAGDEEFFGYLLNAEALERIDRYRLLEIENASGARAHIIAWDEHSPEEKLAEHYSRLGVKVDFERSERFRSDDSITRQSIPELVIRELVDGLDRSTTRLVEPSASASVAMALSNVARVKRSARSPDEVEERAVFFGEAGKGDLFGLLTSPAGGVDGRPGPRLVLVNGGNNHRAGINRNYTEWARDAARRGITTLRFDIRGLGDSPALRLQDLNRLYRGETREDVLAAIDYVSQLGPGGRIILCGLCAGAFQALHAALADERVDTLVLLDLLKWDPDAPNVRASGFLDRRKRQLRGLRSALLKALRIPVRPASNSLGRWLGTLTGRGVEVVAVGCSGKGGFEDFVEAISGDRAQLERTGRLRLHPVRDSDHIFSPLWAQEHLSEILLAAIDRGSDSSGRV